tara:strand:- start:784 stop:966 length:183 start_codon:yes stop_codon:yes gene_type:complete
LDTHHINLEAGRAIVQINRDPDTHGRDLEDAVIGSVVPATREAVAIHAKSIEPSANLLCF